LLSGIGHKKMLSFRTRPNATLALIGITEMSAKKWDLKKIYILFSVNG
jgi:hypothetical protein